MTWTVCVGMKLTIEYCDIEADTEEEAEEIARMQAEEDIDWNNAEFDGTTVYTCYPNDEEDNWEVEE